MILRGRPAHLKIELTNFCNPRLSDVSAQPDAAAGRVHDPGALPFDPRSGDAGLEFAYLHHLASRCSTPRIGELIAYGKRRGAKRWACRPMRRF